MDRLRRERIKGFIIKNTLTIKSLLTSLWQREELPLFEKEGRGEILGAELLERRFRHAAL